ncbi:hypothetical protein [Niveispirillum cyanobacteriorum]|uniref:Uncharacterized protein n=1 Tax=Niveispirillum cyanobacteriorum TaxID=1612173 RepID=A0A2K9NFW4_9PROT|nr:hypothetical protein [Niveispirillum cyanobacteriorum]AUN31989.1 hypothetical protein C0V82_16295 [Niveispirillum cyanobacteriorum]GGE85153.1 hypothetical protein GCM10011317_47950 [Niveispirillum cyanobacteriorum]
MTDAMTTTIKVEGQTPTEFLTFWLRLAQVKGMVASAGVARDDIATAINALIAENDRLRALAKAGYELSTYASCISWDGDRNRGEWLEDLHKDISALQALAIEIGVASPGGVSIDDKRIVREIAKAKAFDAAEDAEAERS